MFHQNKVALSDWKFSTLPVMYSRLKPGVGFTYSTLLSSAKSISTPFNNRLLQNNEKHDFYFRNKFWVGSAAAAETNETSSFFGVTPDVEVFVVDVDVSWRRAHQSAKAAIKVTTRLGPIILRWTSIILFISELERLC